MEAVLIPYLALIALSVIEGRGHLNWSQRFIRFGIDACVLGIGIGGGLFSSDNVQQKFGKHTVAFALGFTLINLLITGVCIHLREFAGIREPWRARISFFLGIVIMGLNAEIVRWTS
jgi:hypothetical protein